MRNEALEIVDDENAGGAYLRTYVYLHHTYAFIFRWRVNYVD